MTSSELFELLWPGEEITNPENALKTLMCRTRSALSRFDSSLSECIITAHGAYRWNTELAQTVDAFAFEALCMELLQVKVYTHEMSEMVDEALALYKGDLSAMSDMADWIISRNAHFSSLFTKTVLHVIRLMEDKHHDVGVIRVAQRGLMVDPLDEEMHLALMRSLVTLNRHHEALSHYHRMQDMFFNEYGIRLPESVKNAYKDLIRTSHWSDVDIETIQQSLQQSNATSNSIVSCEYAVFEEISLPLTRILAQLDTNCCLATMMISSIGEPEESSCLRIQKAMEILLAAIGKILRPFDVVSRCNPTQVVMLLPLATLQSAQELLDKIQLAFKKSSADSMLKLTSKLIAISV